MSRVNKQKLTTELRQFAHRKLCKGELVLLSFAIANRLPLLEDDSESINMKMVKHLRLIERVVYTLQEHAGVDKDCIDTIKTQVGRFLMWRTEVARGNTTILFSGEHNTVIDDLSGLLRFLDSSVLCAVGDVAIKANWLSRVFGETVSLCQDEILDSGE